MNLRNLKSSSGSVKKRKRIGRGPGSGHGKTSTRGHKGQKARSGAKRRPWFEGGQMPIQRRVPKRGFTNIFRKEYQIVDLASLSKCKDREVISPLVMKEFGLIKKVDLPVKILADGEVSGSVTVQANAFSKKAKEKIETLGGKAEVI
ncbi:MAG: 50S ribosomal protein L15 [candidate division Zixibacteria bacterium SM1_73]|nr:MAG: 50S ribosomal protein L15 [candidate division Zixibacteria bacterium SM1_73]